MRKLLLVTFHFPPSAASGTFRLLGFARHLPKCGWGTVVVAPPGTPFDPVDDTLTAKIPAETVVYSVPFPGSFKIVRRLAPNGRWLPAAYRACVRAIAEQHPDALLTSGPPHAVHLLGRLLKGRFDLPWVVDCRDPWTYGTGRPPGNALAKRWERFQEKLVMTAADGIITNSPLACAALQKDLPRFAAKISAITNGFDPEDFPLAQPPGSAEVTLLHTGELYSGRDPRPLFDALREMGVAQAKPLRVKFLGTASDTRIDWPEEIRRRGLENFVTFDGHVGYDQALKEMVRADLLLLLDSPGRRVGLPAKLFEYFGARRPILALADAASDTAWALRQSGVPYRLAHPSDVAGIGRALRELVSEVAATNGTMVPPVPHRFTRAHMAEALAGVLDGVVSRG